MPCKCKDKITAFLVKAGFKDFLKVANQSGPFMFNLAIRRLQSLYSDVFEVDEHVVLERCTDSLPLNAVVDRRIFVDDIRVRAIGQSSFDNEAPSQLQGSNKLHEEVAAPTPTTKKSVYFKSLGTTKKSVYFKSLGWVDIHVYLLGFLSQNNTVKGLALMVDKTQTLISATVIDPVQLSVFRHRFYGVAEMRRVLQKVSVSANIKERLNFSCAIFSSGGDLVNNALYVTDMIGSMIEQWEGRLQDGDVLLSNSPEYGGVHLPDLTLIAPVFDSEVKQIIFWTASRGHHADVGEVLPSSIPPSSKRSSEEGRVFDSFLFMRGMASLIKRY
ncbi:hypothetical protein N7495_001857 [Penicillium taxi]|uniref:uncharacterized protein n=1 Tax=Penicillium taxi TaxID=168475 RepID=UPI0025453934|nr:uncharacterized protein N7495_001857 [Penicillium taxi]KAJ5909175.1 hypothetical protein N7495_001857 [Penicillium taxi]